MGKPDYKAYSPKSYPLKDIDELNIVVLRTEWNDDVVGKIHKSCIKALKDAGIKKDQIHQHTCLLYTSPSPRDRTRSRMPSSA